jgi:phage terminase large subunit
MKVTRVYVETAEAYTNGKRFIINEGGTRSSKTYSELQLFYTIAKNGKKKRVITIVSHSLPHLEGGAIRDFDNILEAEGISPDDVRTKRPYIYTIGKTTIEFVGFDKPGKALGAARDVLFINEANKMPFDICHQLMTRTTEAIFIDYNPANHFWVDEHKYKFRHNAAVIHSTFRDNIENLTEGQIDELLEAKIKAKAEEQAGKIGYWSNYWKVYGLGLKGVVQGVVFPIVTWIDKFPDDVDFVSYGLDFGYTNDPTAVVKIGWYKYGKDLFLEKKMYRPYKNALQLYEPLKAIIGTEKHAWADCADPGMIADLRNMGLKVFAAKKFPGCILFRVDILNRYNLHIVDDTDFKMEQENYKFKEVNDIIFNEPDPNSKYNHLWDAAGYAAQHELR